MFSETQHLHFQPPCLASSYRGKLKAQYTVHTRRAYHVLDLKSCIPVPNYYQIVSSALHIFPNLLYLHIRGSNYAFHFYLLSKSRRVFKNFGEKYIYKSFQPLICIFGKFSNFCDSVVEKCSV